MMKRADSQLLVIFGASGDLTGRKLLPALFELFIGDMLPEHFAILGAARTGYTDEEFRAEQRKHILEARGNKETNSAELDNSVLPGIRFNQLRRICKTERPYPFVAATGKYPGQDYLLPGHSAADVRIGTQVSSGKRHECG